MLTSLLPLLAAWSGPGAPAREALFDDGWKFFRGDVPAPPPAPPPCPASNFPLKVGRCMQLKQLPGTFDADSCRAACCASSACTTFQFFPGAHSGWTKSCWVGDMFKLDCNHTLNGWVTGGRQLPPSGPPPPPPPPPLFAEATFDDSSWRTVSVPHDWSIEDLPARELDTSVPAISIRNGTWKFKQGDDPSWSAAALDDSSWGAVTVPNDWRDPPTSYTKTNATGWYRRNFTITADQMKSFGFAHSEPALALGIVASADTTYVNGNRIGGGSGLTVFRSYSVSPGALVVGSNNIAVRVNSPGGPPGAAGTPGGLCDTPAKATSGVSVATGADWSPPSPFDVARSRATGAKDRSVGYSTNGFGWYRKTFSVPNAAGTRTALRFDGVYMKVNVWINGALLGTHPYGYTTFAYDLTPHLVAGHNVIAVQVDNMGANSRWYSGSGIFRHVHLVTTPDVHVDLWGVAVSTPSVAPDSSMAVARVAVTVANDGAAGIEGAAVQVTIKAPDGASVVGTGSMPVPAVAAGATAEVVFTSLVINGTASGGGANLSAPIALWTLDSPALYSATVTVTHGAVTDAVDVAFGIRTISFTSEGGFLLNGVPTLLKGGCVHHDNGALGSATIDRAEERRVEILKSNGYNAIRTSHNPVSPAFLDACDRIGMVVMDEAFDCWERGKNEADYHVYFDEWWQRDMESMVKRDINHPSVVLWSIGNEIPMRDSEAGYRVAKQLADKVRSLDQSGRAVTSAVPMVKDADEPFFAALDVGGYNYSPGRYVKDHLAHPGRPMVGTESFPDRSFEMWTQYTNHSWVMGDFIWTAIDYIGESAIGNAATTPDYQVSGQPWQWHISFCGDIDIMGMQKPQASYRRVLWDAAPITMLVHHPMSPSQQEHVSGWGWPDERDSWTWPGHEGHPMQVRVFSKCSAESMPGPGVNGSVSLTLDGKPVAGSPMSIGYATEFTATFTVPFAAGKLEAKCTNLDDAPVFALETAGPVVALKATADRSSIKASVNDLSYVTVEVVDALGNRVPDSRENISFAVSGVGALQAVGTGDPTDVSSFHQKTRVSFQGRVVAILRPTAGAGAGTITLTASAVDNKNIKPVTITVTTA